MSHIDETLGSNGHLSKHLPGFSPRDAQLKLSHAIDKAIADGKNLLAEGPTGTGKGAAYLVPAIHHAIENGTRVLVVTANIVLQEQLINKDLPLLRQALPIPFEYGLAKGRGNYLCLDRLDDTQAERALMGPQSGEELLPAIVEWAKHTREGDLSELPFEPTPALRHLFTVQSDDCLGKACPRKEDCYANAARSKLHQAQVIVANYALFYSDLQVKEATDGEVRIIPDFDVLILDEGHRAADIARDFFGFRITAGSVRWAARLLSGQKSKAKTGEIPYIDGPLKDRIGNEANRFFQELASYRKSPDYKSRLRDDNVADTSGILSLLGEASTKYEHAAATGSSDQAARKKLRLASDRCVVIAAGIKAAMSPTKMRSHVFFIDIEGERVSLGSKPIEVSAKLNTTIFENPAIRSTIVTSATLTTGKDDFEFVENELGADNSVHIAVTSPFDYATHTLLVIPKEFDVCLPNESDFVNNTSKLFARIAKLARGRTLGLFTTRRAMDKAYEIALSVLPSEIVVLKQGQAPRSQLVQRFRDNVSSVLIGTSSLWEGVDVQGEALSCVVIDKLPFSPPDDPVVNVLDARDRDAFTKHSLPRAIIAFKQGFGRLIRTVSDRGVVVCLDRRIVEKGYGKNFIRALPPGVRISRDVNDVQVFLDGDKANTETEVSRPHR